MYENWEVTESVDDCPIADFSCPYIDSEGGCHMQCPWTDCDTYMSYMEEEEDY